MALGSFNEISQKTPCITGKTTNKYIKLDVIIKASRETMPFNAANV